MKWPQHRDNKSLHATAPYNFVPQTERIFLSPGEPFAGHDRLDPDRLHGWIDLEIETETPFYIRCAYPPSADPDGTRADRDVPARQETYHHGDEEIPVIPGSSLRGAIRNLVEILAAGRLTRRGRPGEGSRVCDQRLIHRAVADQQTPPGKRYAQRFKNVRAGWLERRTDGGWHIRPALSVGGHSFARVPQNLIANRVEAYDPKITRDNPSPGTRNVWVAGRTQASAWMARQLSTVEVQGWQAATLVPSGAINNRRKFAAVFPPDPIADPLVITEDQWRQWKEEQMLQRPLPNRDVDASDAMEPVFYIVEDGTLVFWGPTQHFRLPYRRWTVDYVPAAHRLPASASESQGRGLDLAESLFGTVNDGRRTLKTRETPEGTHRGRVSFDDAVCRTPSPFLDGPEGGRRYPSILSAPKPTAYQMYLVQPKELGDDKKHMKKQLLAWDACTPDERCAQEETTTLRGFKRYWHRGAPPDLDRSPPESESELMFRSGGLFRREPTAHTTQYTRIRSVKEGARFTGRIRFENLTRLELGGLLAALELPESCRHQLGMGKPLGMGTVRIKPVISLYDPVARYSELSSFTTSGSEKEVDAARREFRRAMIEHHNSSVQTPQIDAVAAELWAIPRLNALRLMMEWEQKPDRERTRNQSLDEFKDRLPLPSPFAVRRVEALPVEAELPPAPSTPTADDVPLVTKKPETSPEKAKTSVVPSTELQKFQAWLNSTAGGKTVQRDLLRMIELDWLAVLSTQSSEERGLAAKAIIRTIKSPKLTAQRDAVLRRLIEGA